MNRIALGVALAALIVLSACAGNRTVRYEGPEVTRVVVFKEARRMYLMHHDQVLADYDIALGFAPEGHKARSGDGRTPEVVLPLLARHQLSECRRCRPRARRWDRPWRRHFHPRLVACGTAPRRGLDLGVHCRPKPRDRTDLRDGRHRDADQHLPLTAQEPRTIVHQILPDGSWNQEKPSSLARGSSMTSRFTGSRIQAASVCSSVS